MSEIPENLAKIIDYVASYVGASTDDWFLVKLELIHQFPPKDRSRFSRRHFSTKKHILNSFDNAVINYWLEITGVTLVVDSEKLHPEDWVQRPKGWGLAEFNERRRKERESEEDS